MINIDAIIEKFITAYLYCEIDKKSVTGIILSGSYARSLQNEHSDLDLHIIVTNSYTYRKRGNIEIDGFLVEYNINPFKQIVKYFEIEKMHNNPLKCTAILEGIIIFEKNKTATRLKTIAKDWIDKDYLPLKSTLVEFKKYQIADTLNKVLSLYYQKSKNFTYSYYSNLKLIYEFYAQYLCQPILKDYMLHDYFSDNVRYDGILDRFPDKEFAEIFKKAMLATTDEERMELYDTLSKYVLKKLGGFELKGWVFELPIDYTNKMDTKTRVF